MDCSLSVGVIWVGTKSSQSLVQQIDQKSPPNLNMQQMNLGSKILRLRLAGGAQVVHELFELRKSSEAGFGASSKMDFVSSPVSLTCRRQKGLLLHLQV